MNAVAAASAMISTFSDSVHPSAQWLSAGLRKRRWDSSVPDVGF